MSDDKQPDNKDLADKAKKSERQRINSILSCEESEGRSKLASHLALNTELSVEDAQGILASSPLEQAAKEDDDDNQQDQFSQAMEQGNPEVGADGGEGDEEKTDADTILADARLAGVYRKN